MLLAQLHGWVSFHRTFSPHFNTTTIYLYFPKPAHHPPTPSSPLLHTKKTPILLEPDTSQPPLQSSQFTLTPQTGRCTFNPCQVSQPSEPTGIITTQNPSDLAKPTRRVLPRTTWSYASPSRGMGNVWVAD